MLACVYSGAVYGVNAFTVEIEVSSGRGDPSVVIVGLPDAAARESKDRVWTALNNADEAAVAEGIEVYPVRHLRDAISFLTGEQNLQPYSVDIKKSYRGIV